MRIWRINVESYTLTSFEFSVIEKWKALLSKVRIKCLFFTYPTVKMGCTSDKFCSKYPLSLSRTSMWNVCSNPPPKPTEHVTDRPWVVWLCTSQFWGGSGGPVKIAQNFQYYICHIEFKPSSYTMVYVAIASIRKTFVYDPYFLRYQFCYIFCSTNAS